MLAAHSAQEADSPGEEKEEKEEKGADGEGEQKVVEEEEEKHFEKELHKTFAGLWTTLQEQQTHRLAPSAKRDNIDTLKRVGDVKQAAMPIEKEHIGGIDLKLMCSLINSLDPSDELLPTPTVIELEDMLVEARYDTEMRPQAARVYFTKDSEHNQRPNCSVYAPPISLELSSILPGVLTLN